MDVLRFQETRFAVRRMRKHPGATLASVAALACGIGAAVASWSLLSAVLLNPLPVEAPDGLYEVGFPQAQLGATLSGHPYPVFEAVRNSGIFDGIAAGAPSPAGLLVIEQGDVPQDRAVFFANHGFFATLGISAALGRTFTEAEDQRGAPPVAVLSERYWRSAFGSDPNVLGETVRVSGTPATIVGILPRRFRGLRLSEAPDLYLPLHVVGAIDDPSLRALNPLGNPTLTWTRIVGRLHSGETPEIAAGRLNAVQVEDGRLDRFGPLTLTNVNTAAIPEGARAGMAQFTTLLSLTVALLLVMGCLTVGMLLLVRTEERRDELAVCLALGATPARLASGIAVEAAILCALSAVLAVPVAVALSRGIRAFQLPGRVEIGRLALVLDSGHWLAVTGAVVAATCLIALLASLVGVGIARASPVQPRAPAAPETRRRFPRTVLVAGQVAITLVLVTGAGLFTMSLNNALNLNPQIETDRVLTADLSLGDYGYSAEQSAAFVDELLDRLNRNGVIESVSIVRGVGSASAGVTIDGVQPELPSVLTYLAVDQNFFSTNGLRIIRGRGFAGTEVAGSASVAVVSESLGRIIADDPIGHRIADWESLRRVLMDQGPPRYAEVIGVVPDVITNVNTTEPLTVYVPIAQLPSTGFAGLVARAASDPDVAMTEILATVRALDSRVSPSRLQTMEQRLAGQMAPQRFGGYVLGLLGGIALLLTVLGTYIVAESLVVRRRREMRIRATLGARGAHLCGLVLRDTARLVGIGLASGLLLAAMGARLIRSLLYQVEPLDLKLLVSVAAVIFVLALLVSVRPAIEAARPDLARALRED